MTDRVGTLTVMASLSVVLGGLACGSTVVESSERVEVVKTRGVQAESQALVTAGAIPASRPPLSSGRVPVGCDRLVSVLARSTASAQLGRCVT